MIRSTLPIAAVALLSACASLGAQRTSSAECGAGGVMPGIEVLLRDSLHLVRGKRVGILTNQSGRDRAGRSTIDLLHAAPGVRLTAIFGPEHGLRGVAQEGEQVASSIDSATGVPIYSLYGQVEVPTPEMLRTIDVLVYDIQDVGARTYTYQWTLAMAAEAAQKVGVPTIVLDRPDPIRGDRVQGGVLEPAHRTMVGKYPVALRYGMTVGELMRYLVGTGQLHADIAVVPMCGWRRSMWYDQTGIPRLDPSPNLRSLDAEILYPGTVLFEGVNVTEGRGTDRPFELVGAPFLTDAGAIARELNAMPIRGVRFDSTSRTIEKGRKWSEQTIPMLAFTVTDRDALDPVEAAVWALRVIYRRHPADWKWLPTIDRLAGTTALRSAIESGDDAVRALLARWKRESDDFAARRKPYLIYE
jgi:uncharacterized protein YbbC (DUF1343 family)